MEGLFAFLVGIASLALVFAVPVMMIVALIKIGDIQRRIENIERKFFKTDERGKSAATDEVADADAVSSEGVRPHWRGSSGGVRGKSAAPGEGTVRVKHDEVVLAPPPFADEVLSAPPPPLAAEVAEVAGAEIEKEIAPRNSSFNLPHSALPREPDALSLAMDRVRDWLLVKGAAAPEGMSREFAFATRWLLRIGVLLIVASVVYFLKLSVDRGWVGPAQRVLSTALFGGAMGALGAWLVKRTRYGLLGHAFSGIGFAALYLGFGLAHRFFDPPVIASPALAFLALAAVTVLGFGMAAWLNSSTIALLSLLGGYLVPVIAGRDSGSPLMLDLYLATLNLGVFAVSRLRGWSLHDFLASLAAALMCFVWSARHAPLLDSEIINIVFITAVHFLYFASVVASASRRTKAATCVAWGGLALNACVLTAYLVRALRFSGLFANSVSALAMLALFAAYMAAAVVSSRRGWLDSVSRDITVFFALVFLCLAPLLALDAAYLSPCWCAIALACVASAEKIPTGQRVFRGMGFAVLALTTLFVLAKCLDAGGEEGFIVRKNFRSVWEWLALAGRDFIRVGVVPIAFGAAAWLENRAGRATSRNVLAVAALVAAFLYLSDEAYRVSTSFRLGLGGGAVTVVWGVYAMALLVAGVVRRMKAVRLGGLFILALAVVKLLLSDTSRLDLPWRVGVFALTGALLISGAFLYIKFQSSGKTEKPS